MEEKEEKINREGTKKISRKRFWWTTGILLALFIITTVASSAFFLNIRKNIVNDNDIAALEVFKEVANGFLNNFELNAEKTIGTEVKDYGVSKDGDFYISFKYFVRDEEDINYTEEGDARVYFWTDKETGRRSFGFSYDE